MSPVYLFFISLFFVFGSLELVVRKNVEVFYALTQKQLVKIEMLKNKPRNDFVLIGSSRGQDCCDTDYMSKWIETTKGKNFRFFNASSTGYNVKSFKHMSSEVEKTNNAKRILIEISTAAYSKGKFITLDEIKAKNNITKQSKRTIEEKLQDSLHDASYLVKFRKALKPKLLFRLFMIKTSDMFSHEIWFRRNLLKQIFSGYYEYTRPEMLPSIYPKIFKAGKEGSLTQLDDKETKIFDALKSLENDFYLINYPVKNSYYDRECNEKKHHFYQYLANKLKTFVIDYSCRELPFKFYKDDNHLNEEGRMIFSQMLARDLYQISRDDD